MGTSFLWPQSKCVETRTSYSQSCPSWILTNLVAPFVSQFAGHWNCKTADRGRPVSSHTAPPPRNCRKARWLCGALRLSLEELTPGFTLTIVMLTSSTAADSDVLFKVPSA